MLTLLPNFGDTQVAHFKLTEKENKERHEALTSFLPKTKYSAAKKATFLTWATYFVEGPGNKSAYQLEAFLAYWLNYFIFPSPLRMEFIHSSSQWRCFSRGGKGYPSRRGFWVRCTSAWTRLHGT